MNLNTHIYTTVLIDITPLRKKEKKQRKETKERKLV